MDFSIRFAVFCTVLISLLAWQTLRPRRRLSNWRQRWYHNLALLLIGALCVRLVQPLLLSAIAFWGQDIGLLSHLDWPVWCLIVLSILMLDCLIYWQHRLFHRIPLLWRLHRVHHTDPELDVSSAVRFHPFEILLSLLVKATAILLLGIPVVAVLLFDILLNTAAMFNHTNARLPAKWEAVLQRVIVTPDFHRIHHSRVNSEANSNFGFFLSIWDTLFASKRWQAIGGDDALNIGLPGTKTYQPKSLRALLWMPFKLVIHKS